MTHTPLGADLAQNFPNRKGGSVLDRSSNSDQARGPRSRSRAIGQLSRSWPIGLISSEAGRAKKIFNCVRRSASRSVSWMLRLCSHTTLRKKNFFYDMQLSCQKLRSARTQRNQNPSLCSMSNRNRNDHDHRSWSVSKHFAARNVSVELRSSERRKLSLQLSHVSANNLSETNCLSLTVS